MIPDHVTIAARDCNTAAVADWLAAHPQSVNDVDLHGASLLLQCVEEDRFDGMASDQDDQLELLCYLLVQGADPNRICDLAGEDQGTMTPLYAASGGNNFPHTPQIVARLLRAGANPNLKVDAPTSDPVAPLATAIENLLAVSNGSWQLPVVAYLLRYGASLDNCAGDRSAEDVIANEEREWTDMAEHDVYFQAAKTLIHGVRAAGSWKKYCRARAPHREILALRSLAMRGYITPYQKRRTRATDWKAIVAFVARLGDNGVVWNILSFWRDPDDVEEIVVPDFRGGRRVVRVYD